jgi:menaquinone-dependent protoporphyrinogen oxidase
MAAPILVAYATKYGSTQEVAEAIAARLREHALEVEVQPASAVRSLDQYSAVVLGGPFFVGRWHKDTSSFLKRHRAALMARPVAIFALGPLAGSTEQQWQDAREQLDKTLPNFPWLAPVAVEMFGGVYDPAKLRFPDSLVRSLPASPLKNAPASDARDWPAIRAWADKLASTLQPAAV